MSDSIKHRDAENPSLDGRRYANSDISGFRGEMDPSSSEDELGSSKLDWIKSNKALSSLLTFGFIIAVYALWRLAKPFFNFLMNPYTYVIVGVIIVLLIVFRAGVRWYSSRLKKYDKLNVQYDSTAEKWTGEMDTDANGNQIMYIHRGYSRFRKSPRWLTVSDVAPELTDKIGSNVDGDDRIPIRIPDELGEDTLTDMYGREIMVRSGGIELDESSNPPALRLMRPDTVTKSTYKDLVSSFQSLRDIVDSQEQQIQNLRIERNKARRKAVEGVDESIDRVVSWIERIEQSKSPPSGQQGQMMPYRMPESNPVDDIRSNDGDSK